MFKPNQEAINTAYRREQEIRAEKARLAQSVTDKELNFLVRYARNTNIGSSLIFVLAIVALIIFFGLSSASASAQENSSLEPGEGDSGGNMDMLYLRAAVVDVQEGDYETAMRLFNDISERSPDLAVAYTGRAYVEFLEGDYELALEDATMAFELDPSDAAIYYVLAEIHFAMGTYTDARLQYEAYQSWVEDFEGEPILIVAMLGESSLDIVSEHLALSIAYASEEEIV